MRERPSTADYDRWLLGVAVLAMYAWLAPTYIVDGDNAEFATLGTRE